MSDSTTLLIAWITAAFAFMMLLMSLTMNGTFMGGVHTSTGMFWYMLLLAGGTVGALLYWRSRQQQKTGP